MSVELREGLFLSALETFFHLVALYVLHPKSILQTAYSYKGI
jgi:hypothetical protein